MATVDVIVIGGGIAGLTAAAFAAKAGADTLLLEAAPEFGGRARTRIVSGFHFNRGAHALYRDGFLDTALRDLGVTVTGSRPPLADGFFVDGGVLHRAPFSAAGLASLFRRLHDGSIDTAPGTSLADALADLSPSTDIRAALTAMVRLTSLVHAPQAADARALLDQLRGALVRGALYLDGGWGTMIDGLRSACVGSGVGLRAGSRVASLDHDGAWRATLADGTGLAARAIVLAVDPAQAAALHPARGPVTPPVPAHVACLDLGLARLPRPDALFALGVDRPLYFSVHSTAARLAPEGAALVHAVRYLEPGETPDRHALVAELEGFIDLVQPGWREYERARQFLSGMPAISAIPLAATGGMDGRPGMAIADAPGLFRAGDWVGAAGLLGDAAAVSGRSAGETAAAFARR